MFERLKRGAEILKRLRGKKRSGEEILQAHKRIVNFAPQKNFVPPQEKISAEEFVLDIKNAADMENYSSKLNNLRGFEEFTFLKWLAVRLDRIKKILAGLSALDDFDSGEFNLILAGKVRDVAKIMLDIYRYAKSSTELDKNSRERLIDIAENYLASIGLSKKFFNVGDDFGDWADLNMKDSYEIIPTKNRNLTGKIAAIEIQPHIIFYRGEFGDVEQLTFGGSCRVYKFKEW